MLYIPEIYVLVRTWYFCTAAQGDENMYPCREKRLMTRVVACGMCMVAYEEAHTHTYEYVCP